MRACWTTVRQDFVDVFQQLYEMRGRGFSKLNQALITMLPKRADATTLNDYRPISLIHLVAKIFAKVLSLRLAPKLDSLVSRSQNAFIAGRSLHDNFILVKQSARLLHQLGAPRILLKLDLTHAFDSWRSCANMALGTGFWSGSLSSSHQRAHEYLRTASRAHLFGTARVTRHRSCLCSLSTSYAGSSSTQKDHVNHRSHDSLAAAYTCKIRC